HKPSRLHSQTIHRSGRCDVEGPIVFVSPSEVCWLLRHFDCAQMVAICIPNPYALGAGNVQIASYVHLDSIGHAFMLFSMFLAENAASASGTICPHVINPNISLLFVVIIHVELFSIGRKRESVGLSKIFGQKR